MDNWQNRTFYYLYPYYAICPHDCAVYEASIFFPSIIHGKGRLSYHLFIKCFSQLSFDSEIYTKLAAVADFVYTSESNESCEKHSTQR